MSADNNGNDRFDGNGNVLKYFMEQTNQRLSHIEKKLDDLASFKASMMTSSKIVSAIISIVVSVGASVLLKVLS